jgi:hypothetical protein
MVLVRVGEAFQDRLAFLTDLDVLFDGGVGHVTDGIGGEQAQGGLSRAGRHGIWPLAFE